MADERQTQSKRVFLQLTGKDTCGEQHADCVRVYRSEATQIPLVRCTVCDWSIDVYAECRKPPDHDSEVFRSSRLAEAFAHWTGDVEVPIQVIFPQIPGIVPEPVISPLNRVYNTVQALRKLNEPFAPTSADSELKPKILTHFLEEFSLRVKEYEKKTQQNKESGMTSAENRVPRSMDKDQIMIEILKVFRNHVSGDENDTGQMMFEHYDTQVVPYVLSVSEENGDSQPSLLEVEGPLAKQLYLQVLNSSRVRNHYGRYSLMLEIVHIMVTCYACLTNQRVAANWTFDLVARILRGNFFQVDTPSLRKVQVILQKYVNRRTDTDLYYVLRGLQQSQRPEDLYSEEFFEKFDRMSKLVKKHLTREGETCTTKKKPTLEMMYYSGFPEGVFASHADSLGFTIAMTHINMMTFRNKFGINRRKGAIATAKRLHRVIRSLVQQVRAFEQNEKGQLGEIFWTFDTFETFMATNDKLNDLVKDLFETFMISMEGEEQERSGVHNIQPQSKLEEVKQDESQPSKKPCNNSRIWNRKFGSVEPETQLYGQLQENEEDMEIL